MPTIDPNTRVTITTTSVACLVYPPPGDKLVVAVEDAALRARANGLTTVVACSPDGVVTWVGSVDETMLSLTSTSTDEEPAVDARAALTRRLLVGSRVWDVIRPGTLRSAASRVQDTVYQGDRPWVVIGELESGGLIAVALNDIGGGVRGHYQYEVKAQHLIFSGSKDSKLELNHVWSFPALTPAVGTIDSAARQGISAAVKGYFPGRRR